MLDRAARWSGCRPTLPLNPPPTARTQEVQVLPVPTGYLQIQPPSVVQEPQPPDRGVPTDSLETDTDERRRVRDSEPSHCANQALVSCCETYLDPGPTLVSRLPIHVFLTG